MNIQGLDNIIDPFYRYKMQKLNVVQQKNKTVIDNINKVSADLEREPELIYNYFKKKLSISMNMKDGVLSTAAKLSYNDFEKVLREFIDEYVLCPKCKLPELVLTENKSKYLMTCKSCSYSGLKKK